MAKDIKISIVVDSKGNMVKQSAKQMSNLGTEVKKTDKNTKRLNKTQGQNYNRQKQGVIQTANSTKNFSKMSGTIGGDGGGPGGLVRAYALLAANVFALTAAFGVLSRSAQIDTLNESMEVLSTTGGTYIKNLAKDMQAASGHAVDLAQSFRQVSLAASAGLSTKEIEGLTMVAKGAAISLGRNLPDAMDRIFRGAIKLEPEILDEIGLFVRVDEAAQKFARNNGKVVSSLTQVEKRQAFLNEILEQGTRKFAVYADTIKPDPYVRLGAALGDIAQGGLSVINSVLGPLLGFLSESKTLLSIVFGTLVFALVKKAIPAMGLFTQSQAEQANLAAKNAADYTRNIRETTDTLFQENKKKLDDEIKTQTKMNRARQMTPTKVGGRKSQVAIEKKLQSKTLSADKRSILVNQRILDLKKGQNKRDGESAILAQAEIDALETEVRLNRELLDLKTTGAMVTDPKQLSGRRQAKLDEKAGGAGIIALSTGIGENQGMRAGWSALVKDVDAGYDVLDEKGEKVANSAKKQFGGMKKVALKASGGLSLLAGGMSRLMMAMGPIMMGLSLLLPLLAMFGKALGIGREEEKAFTEQTKRMDDQLKNLTDRFRTQTDQIKSGKLTWTEETKARVAYGKGILETTDNMQKLDEDFIKMQKSGNMFTAMWDRMGFSMKQGAKATIKNALIMESSLAVLEAAIRNKDEAILDGYKVLESDQFVTAMNAQIVAEENALKSKEALIEATKSEIGLSASSIKAIQGSMNIVSQLYKINGEGADVSKTLAVLKKDMTKEEVKYFNSLLLVNSATRASSTASKTLSKDMDKHVAVGTINNKIIKEQVSLYENLVSAMTGASESVGKFQNQFMPKTKVDDVLGSFDQIEAGFLDIQNSTTGAISSNLQDDFFAQFGDADNPFSSLMSSLTKNVTEMVDGVETVVRRLKDDSGKEAAGAFSKTSAALKVYRDTVIRTKATVASLKAEQKLLTTLTKGGLEINTKRQKAFTQELKKTLELQKALTSTALISFGLDDLAAKNLVAEIDNVTTIAAKKKVIELSELSVNQKKQANAYLDQQEIKRIDYLIAVEQESLLIKKEGLKAKEKLVAATKELSNAKQKELEIETKLHALASTGTLELNPVLANKLALDTAMRKRDIMIEESKIKMLLLDVEEKLLLARIDVLEREAKLVGINVGALKDNITKATGMQKTALSTMITNASGQLAIDIATATQTGFSGGMTGGIGIGISNLRTQLDDIEKRKKAAKDAAFADTFASSGSIEASVNARTEAGKPFIEEAAIAESNMAMQTFRNSILQTVEALKQLGPEGVAAAAFMSGTLSITDNMFAMTDSLELLKDKGIEGMAQTAEKAKFVASSLSTIGSMIMANSAAQTAEIDKQIAAEKKRDGTSAASVAKMKSLEAKKHAMAKKAFNMNKKIQMASVAINTAAAIMQVMSAPGDFYKTYGLPMSIFVGAMGAMQLAMIAKSSYDGGGSSIEAGASPTSLTLGGGRGSKVDVSQRASSGELSYLRGERGSGSGANDFRGGGATGRKGYAVGGLLVGEQGPERIDVVPNEGLNKRGGETNVTLNISAIDGQSVQTMFSENQGNIIQMIRDAANENGTDFLPTIDTSVYNTTGGAG